MKKMYIYILLFLFFIFGITLIGGMIVTGDKEIKEGKDIMVIQTNKEVYFKPYGYDITNPNVILNPYGNSPLTAIIMFETDDYSEVNITIKGANGSSDINYTFPKDKYHIIPVYGLYPDYDNTVIIKSDGKSNSVSIKTDKLPDDFEVNNTSDSDFTFYNDNYPYLLDSNNNVRWYFNIKYYGTATFLNNSRIIIGSDSYNESGSTNSVYMMNLLGKIYNEYILPDGYYGINSVYEDNLLVLSDKLLLVDMQTGDIVKKFIDNDDYDYMCVSDNNIIVGKEDSYFKLDIKNNKLESVDIQRDNKTYFLYDSTTNYIVSPSSRFGELPITKSSNKNVSLVKYTKDNTKDVSVTYERDRLKVTNNTEEKIYIILDKFLDKRVYEVGDVKYINTTSLHGKYTIYYKIKDKVYKTDYYIEV